MWVIVLWTTIIKCIKLINTHLIPLIILAFSLSITKASRITVIFLSDLHNIYTWLVISVHFNQQRRFLFACLIFIKFLVHSVVLNRVWRSLRALLSTNLLLLHSVGIYLFLGFEWINTMSLHSLFSLWTIPSIQGLLSSFFVHRSFIVDYFTQFLV